MYPIKAILIGCTYEVLPDLRRELSNLSVALDGEFLDAHSCLAQLLTNPAEKRLIVFQVRSAADIAHLGRLNEAAIGQPILALVDPANDPTMMVRAMRAGAAQVVRLPLAADDFCAAMHRIAVQFGHPLTHSRVITVLGATEGSGATTIATNLASEIGRLRNAPCILAEGAVSFGRLAHHLNIEPQLTIGDLLADMDHLDIERVRRALTQVEDNLQVLAGSYRAITPAALKSEDVFKLVGYVKQLADVLVVDGRYAYEPLDFDFVAQSQQVVLVVSPTVPSLFSLKRVLELLAERECLAQQYVVVNRFIPNAHDFSLARIREVFDAPHVLTVANDWACVSAAENAGQTLRKAAPDSRALADIGTLARAVLGITTAPPRMGWTWLDSLNRAVHPFSLK